MAKGLATESLCDCCTICLPLSEEQYRQLVDHGGKFRQFLDHCHQQLPELFPADFSQGYEMKDCRTPKKLQVKLRRIELRSGAAYTIRPSFLMPYRTPNRRSFSQHLRVLRSWAESHLSGIVLESVVDLCDKRDRRSVAYDYPQGHRTSNMLDRLMRGMNRYFFDGQHLHGSRETSERHSRAWALLWNFAPWHPTVASDHNGWSSPAERLNKHRYHINWLQNLLISASLGGYRQGGPQKT